MRGFWSRKHFLSTTQPFSTFRFRRALFSFSCTHVLKIEASLFIKAEVAFGDQSWFFSRSWQHFNKDLGEDFLRSKSKPWLFFEVPPKLLHFRRDLFYFSTTHFLLFFAGVFQKALSIKIKIPPKHCLLKTPLKKSTTSNSLIKVFFIKLYNKIKLKIYIPLPLPLFNILYNPSITKNNI